MIFHFSNIKFSRILPCEFKFVLTILVVISFSLSAISQSTVVTFNFDNDIVTGWTTSASGLNGESDGRTSWSINNPNGGQGYNELFLQREFIGNPDPVSDHTLSNTTNNVAGQGLGTSNRRQGRSGHYNNSSEWIKSPAINCANYYNVTLEYYRWANFEPGKDKALVEVSNDGDTWNEVYSSYNLEDTSWVKHTIDISKYADRHTTVYIRWRSESDDVVFYAGWNIDDISITGEFTTNDFTSDIRVGATPIPNTVSSIIDTYDEKITIGEFVISDAGSGDGLPTIVDTLIISQGPFNEISDWSKSIANIYLYDVSIGKYRKGIIQSNQVIFPFPVFFNIPDGGSKNFEISFYLKPNLTNVIDNSQFEFEIDYGKQIMDPSGSFIGSGVLQTGASKIVVDIEATQLSFYKNTVQLVSVNRTPTPFMQVAATDMNGNVDTDKNGTITLSNSGNLKMTGNVASTQNGLAVFTGFQINEAGGPVTLIPAIDDSSLPGNLSEVTITVKDNIDADIAFSDNFDNSGVTGWTTGANIGSSSWVKGNPNGGRGFSAEFPGFGAIGNADPTQDYSTNTINNVYGEGLGVTNVHEGRSGYFNNTDSWVMTPAINLSEYYSTQLSFQRWANMEPQYDSAFVEISNDGINWIDLGQPLFPTDNQWAEVIIDISSIADRQSTVYIRWRSVTDNSIFYAGWNIDDVIVSGIYSPRINWTGTVSNDWNTGTNWSTGNVPGLLTNVFIEAGTPFRPIVSTSAECNEVVIKRNAILEIDTEGELNVFGNVTIETDEFNYGALIDHGTININGKGKISRFLKSNDWHYVSSPVENASSVEIGSGVYYYDEPTASNNWLKGWIPVENQQLEVGRGYDVQKTVDEVVYIEGTFNTGDYTVSLTNTDGPEIAEHEGWNLIGNPYPSAIDWDAAGWTKDNVNDAIYIWDEDLQNFVTYISGVGVNGGSNYIPPMQGFFVKVTNPGTGSVTMTNDVRIANIQSKLKAAAPGNEGFVLSITNGNFRDETIFRLDDNAGYGFDNSFDAYKKFSDNYLVPQIYTTTSKGDELAINSYPAGVEYAQIPVNVKVARTGTYVIEFIGDWNIDPSKTIYLEDILEDTLIDARKALDYMFTTKDIHVKGRFVLHVGMPLEVESVVHQISEDGSQKGAIDCFIIGGVQPLKIVEWSNGATTPSINNLEAGTYSVTIIDGADNTIFETFVISGSEGTTPIHEEIEDAAETIPIYAFEKTLHIVSNNFNPISLVQVFDASGKLLIVEQGEFVGEKTFDLNHLQGMFVVKIIHGDTSLTQKILLK
jgi:hypothetical protein